MTNWKGAAALTVVPLEIAGFKLPLLKMSVIVSALLSARFEKLATPAETVAVFVPCSGACAALKRHRDHAAVIARLDVAELVCFRDDRLSGKSLPGRRSR